MSQELSSVMISGDAGNQATGRNAWETGSGPTHGMLERASFGGGH